MARLFYLIINPFILDHSVVAASVALAGPEFKLVLCGDGGWEHGSGKDGLEEHGSIEAFNSLRFGICLGGGVGKTTLVKRHLTGKKFGYVSR